MPFAACGGDDDDGGGETHGLFDPVPECEGAAITPLSGDQAMVMSSLAIGKPADGFDLDHDGEPDNQLAGIGGLVGNSLTDQFDSFDIVLPIEYFDLPSAAVDDCVKFAVYIGVYKLDLDTDGKATAEKGGDCNDHESTISPGMPEIADNGRDDDCNGLADDDAGTPSASTADADGDGVTIADGDCDDTLATVKPGLAEVCGDGLDNDCDGVADFTAGDVPACSPYDGVGGESIALDPRSFDDGGKPIIAFDSGAITDAAGTLQLDAGPSIFAVDIPVSGINLQLKLTGASFTGDVVMTANGPSIENGRLGGVIDARTADTIRGLEVEQIMLSPEDSLLDAIFANVLSALLGLHQGDALDQGSCYVPDIDVDQDGIEQFCDSDPTDDKKTVDVCIDGDGTVVRDEVDGAGNVTSHCTEATNPDGSYRFVDGVSVALTFTAAPALIGDILAQ